MVDPLLFLQRKEPKKAGDLTRIVEVSRHCAPRTVLGYVRRANAFMDHAGAAFRYAAARSDDVGDLGHCRSDAPET